MMYDEEYEKVNGSAIVIGFVVSAICGAGAALLFIQILNVLR